MSMTWSLWSRLARRPATTHLRQVSSAHEEVYHQTYPHDPPPHTIMSTSSGTVILACLFNESLTQLRSKYVQGNTLVQTKKTSRGPLLYVYSAVSAQHGARGSGGQGTYLHRNKHLRGRMRDGYRSGMRFDRAGRNASDHLQGIETYAMSRCLLGGTGPTQLLRRTVTSHGSRCLAICSANPHASFV